jgi:two-component system response regulator YesN
MYRVLLVDDELEIRNGLKLKINWAALQFVIAGEAQDGREALALLAQESYDLILTDIRMPIMSGLELLKQCAEYYPQSKVIVLSGHDDFHYVKAALQCGAKDYLLKPVVRSELTQILDKLREELDIQKQELSEKSSVQHQLQQSNYTLQEQLLLEWISNGDEDRDLTLRSETERLGMDKVLNDSSVLRFISVEFRLPEGRLGDQQEKYGLFRMAFQLVCRETTQDPLCNNTVYAFYHRSYPQMMNFMISTQSDVENDRITQSFSRLIEAHIHRYLRVESVIGIGEQVQGVKGIRKGFLSALLAWSQSQSGAVSQIISSDSSADTFAELFPEVEKRLLLALDNGDIQLFSRTLETVVQAGRYPLQGVASFVLRVILLLDQTARKYNLDIPETQDWMFSEMVWKLHTESSAILYLSRIATQVIEGIKLTCISGGVEVVNAIRKHIDDSYMNELSLSMLADRFHINSTYLSELFKKQNGTTFSDYVTQVRIQHAIELLRDPHMRLSDIAELVGFANASYLSSVFKKQFGISPNEYRNHPNPLPT